MRKFKKTVCIMLCAAMCLGNIPVYAADQVSAGGVPAEEGTEEVQDVSGQEAETEDEYAESEAVSAAAEYGNSISEEDTYVYDEPEYAEEDQTTGKVLFVDTATGAEIPGEVLSFDREYVYESGGYYFPGTHTGDAVRYKISGEDIAEAEGIVILGEYDLTVSEEYIVKTSMDVRQVSIKKRYGDSDFSLLDYISVPSDYTGQVSCRIISGDDAVSVGEDGTVKILAAKDAEAEVVFAADRQYKETSVTVSISVQKAAVGKINAEDVAWDSLEKAYEEDGSYILTGTVNTVGAELADVTAYVTARDNRIGTTNTTVTDAEFSGSENYEISMMDEGPKITITGTRDKLAQGTEGETEEEPSVTASYDNNDPVNESYFNEKRTLTITVNDKEFNEALLSVSVETDGGTLTLPDIRSGQDGLVLAADGETDEETGTVTYKIEFGAEGTEKTFSTSVSYNGKEAEIEGDPAGSFCVDMLAPELSVAFEKEDGSPFEPSQEEPSVYSISPVTAVITVKDGSFSQTGAAVSVTAKDADGKDISAQAYPSSYTDQAHTDEWEKDGDTHTFRMEPFESDANYGISAGYTDLAGNSAEPYEEHIFTIDAAAPEGKIFVTTADGEKKEYERVLTEKEQAQGLIGFVFDLFSKKVTLESEASDKTSGILSMQYYLADVEKDAGLDFEQKAVLEELEWEDYREGIVVDTDRIFVILEKITDRAGNVSYISSGGGMIVDTKEPGIPVIMIKGAKEEVYNHNLAFDIYVTDPDNGGEGIFSGIKTVSYEITDNKGEKTEKIGGKEIASPRQRDISDSVLVSTAKYNKNGLVLRVTAEDYAGNKAVKEQAFSIDTTDPVLNISFDESAARNGHYFNETQKMTASFIERNFDEKKTVLHVTCDGTEYTYTMKDLEDEKAKEIGILVSEKTDSEKDVEESSLTDKREVTYTLLLGEGAGTDRDYSAIKFVCEDAAGNRSEKEYDALDMITVDKIAPVTAAAYYEGGSNITSSVSRQKDAPYYTNRDVSVSISVTERNFSAEGLGITLTQEDSSGNSVSAYDGISSMQEESGWSQEGAEHKKTMPAFSGDANYGIGFTYTDLAGNEAAEYRTHYFTVDKAAPEGSITVDSTDGTETYDSFTRQVVFRFISRYSITLSREAYDSTSGIASVRYYRYTPPVYASGIFGGMSLESLRSADWREWREDSSVAVDPDSQAVIYARIADRAGNITYINTEGAMIADSTDPERPEIRINISEPDGGIFNSDVPVAYSVQDVVSGDTYAGLRRVSVQVMNGNSVTQSSSMDFDDKSARQRTAEGSIVIDAEENNSNDVTVIVTAEDYAGNISSAEEQLAIDITAPRIEVEYDLNDPVNERYYNQVRTATVTVYERNFDPSGADISLSSSLGASARISEWTVGGQAGVSDDNPNTCTIVYEEDSDYSFTIAVTDRAGNRSEYGQTDSFTIDRTDPEISVSFDYEKGSRYYDRARTATITVKDRNFDESAFTQTINASLEGRAIDAPSLSGWSGTDEYHTATIVFADDGDYSFELGGMDLAGNTAQGYTSPLFTVDTTAPEVSFSGVEDNSANKGAVEPAVSYFDINLDIGNGVRVYLEGYRHDKKEITGEITGTRGSFSLEDFAQALENDDVYTLTAVVRDLAGNETTKTITFSVNRFGSNFYFSEETAKYITDYYHKDAEDIVIYEVNVDSVTDAAVTLIHDGVSKTLEKDSFTIKDMTDKDAWNRYMYTIPKRLFTEEGIYEIVVTSTDKAGNKQDNRTKKAPAAFIVDRTSPGIVITGIENGEVYNEKERTFTVAVSDDHAARSVNIFVDGEKVKEFNEEEIRSGEGKLSYTLQESGNWVSIFADAADKAGNTASTQEYRVLLTTNLFRRIVNSGAAPFGIPILLLLLAAAGFAAKKFSSGR